MKYYLELKDITHSYHSINGETNVLNNISFGVNEGEFIAIVGPSGCGKSTLLSIIAGLIQPDYGTIIFDTKGKKFNGPNIGYMFQKDNLFEWKNIYKNIILGLEINHICTDENLEYVNKMIKDYGLYNFIDKKPSELSGGMRQRAALIRTLALKPDVLLLDEPFSALDYQNRIIVSSDICSIIRKTKKTMIMVTHDLAEAISIADRIFVLSARPSYIKMAVKIDIKKENDMISVRNCPEFQDYFNLIWEEIKNEGCSG